MSMSLAARQTKETPVKLMLDVINAGRYDLRVPPGNIMRTITPVSPGEMLEEEFLKPLGLSKYRLAKDIGVPAQRIGDIVAGKRAITADTDLRLCRYFGLSDGWWLRGQANYDTAIAREEMGEALSRTKNIFRLCVARNLKPTLIPHQIL